MADDPTGAKTTRRDQAISNPTPVEEASRVMPPNLVPDAWERFEAAVDKAVKAPPQHRAKERAPHEPTNSERTKRPS